MNKKTLKDIDVKGKKILVRCDFNVPVDENGNITDDTRIISSLPTINYLLDEGASLILMSHLGRPKGKADKRYSLMPVAKRLGELLNKNIVFEDCSTVVDDKVRKKASELKSGDVILLQNTRFRKEETKNSGNFGFFFSES